MDAIPHPRCPQFAWLKWIKSEGLATAIGSIGSSYVALQDNLNPTCAFCRTGAFCNVYQYIYIYKSSFTYTYHYTVPLYSTLISYYIHTNLATLLPLSHKHCNRECNAVELPPRSFHPMSHDGAGGGRATGHLLSLCRWRWLKGHQTAGVESGGWPKAWMMDG